MIENIQNGKALEKLKKLNENSYSPYSKFRVSAIAVMKDGQEFGGVNVEKEDCTRAVTETKGMVVTYNGKPASVFYYASSSGESLNVPFVICSKIP